MRLFSRQDREPGWLVFDIAGETIRILHVDPAQKPPRIRFHDSRPFPGRDIKVLERLGRECRAARCACTTLLQQGEYQLLLVDAPSVPQAELKTAMRWRVKDMLDYHVDDATIDVFNVPFVEGGRRSMYAVAARTETLGTRVSLFEEARVPVSVIDIPEMAQRNIAALFEQEGRALAMLYFDRGGGLLTITAGGELYLARRIEVASTQLADAERRQAAFERILLELQRSLDHFDRQFAHLPVNRLLLAPLGVSTDLLEYLVQNLYLPVEAADMQSVLDLSSVPELASETALAEWFLPIGAGMRVEEARP